MTPELPLAAALLLSFALAAAWCVWRLLRTLSHLLDAFDLALGDDEYDATADAIRESEAADAAGREELDLHRERGGR